MNTIEQSLNLAQNYLNQQRFLYVFQYPLLISMKMCRNICLDRHLDVSLLNFINHIYIYIDT